MSCNVRSCFVPAVLFLVASQSGAQVLVYSQPYEHSDGPYSDGVPGQYWSTRIADNLALSDQYNRKITVVRWWGCSENSLYADLTSFSAWVIKFYDDDGDLPGTELFSEQFPIGETDPVFIGEHHWEGGEVYEHTATLSAPPTLYIDVPYWISIGAVNSDEGDDGWHWSLNYSGGDRRAAEDHFDATGYFERLDEEDLAFELFGVRAAGCPRPGCEVGDVDGDCDIDLSDLAALLAGYRACEGDPEYDPDADFDDSGCIDLSDLAALLGNYRHDCTY